MTTDTLDSTATATGEELLAWREEFPILAETTYLINNSLGAMPRAVRGDLAAYADAWEQRGVRAWHEGWWESAVEVGDLLAPLLGVAPGNVSMHQNASVAAGLFFSCFDYPAERNRIVYTELNFPSIMYLAENERRRGAEVVVVPSDDGIGVPVERLLAAIDERTRLVPISHTYFKSAYVQDAAAVARRCREVGAILLLDVYQSTGAVPLALEQWGVDAAVGGSVKWLCGGPGAGYLWVDPKLAATLRPALTGWQADEEPFSFRPGPIHYAEGAWRFLTGTPNVPALHACAAGYRIVAGIGPAICQRSYEVGPEFPQPFIAQAESNRDFFCPASRAGHFMFDLKGYVARRLAAADIKNVQVLPCDTCAEDTRFFSYRRACQRGEPDYGRGLSVICLEP